MRRFEKSETAAMAAVLKQGGVIILVAQCPDGAGTVPDWFEGASSPKDVIDKFVRDGWSPEAHAKPFLLARPLSNHHVIAVCDGISEENLNKMFITPAKDIEDAFRKACEYCRLDDPRILVLPTAGDVIPLIEV